MIYEKKDNSTLIVVKQITTAEQRTEYNIETLKNQRLAILKSLNDFTIARKSELAEVNKMILEAEKLGIKPTVDVKIAIEEAKLL